MNLHTLRENRAKKIEAMKALIDGAAAANRDLTADEVKEFDAAKAEERALSAQIERHEHLASLEVRTAAPVGNDTAEKLESRINLLDAVAAQVENRSLTGALAEFNQEQRNQGVEARGVLVPASIFEKRAANTTTTADGIVPEDFRADQFVGLLRNSAIVRSLGARTLSGLRGNVVIPKQTSTTAATWLAEGDSLSDADPLAFDTVTLQPRHVGALTELSRQLIQQANPDIERLVRDDFVQVIGLAVDRALLHGDGVKEPAGLVDTATGTGTLATLNWENVLKVIEDLNLDHINPNYWLTTPQVATKLRSTLKAASAGSAYLMESGQMAGIPVAVTQQLENVSDSNGDAGRIIVGDFSELLIGTWGAVDILANPYGAAYARGGVQIRILTTMDAAVRRPEAFSLIEDVVI